jgi:hypothetical protein
LRTTSTAQLELLKIALENAGKMSFEVVTPSMSPLISVGDKISVRPLNQARIRRFDILVFLQSGIMICHYLHHINQTDMSTKKYITKSLNGRDDLPISIDEVLGIVESHSIPWWLKLRLSLCV